jgi:nitrous oxidase accessory protein
MLRALALLVLLSSPLRAAELHVQPGAGTLANAIAGATPGDVLLLSGGTYLGPVTIDRALTLQGDGTATIDGQGQGTVITVTGNDVVLAGLTVTGSGGNNQAIDSGIKVVRGVERTRIEANRLTDNMHGVDIHGGRDTLVRGNTIEGRRNPRMNERGNGFYVWNSPGTVIEDNQVRWGRDGIFANASKKDIFRNNSFRDLRFAIHYMYTHDSEVSGNISIGNHLGFAIMFSDRVVVTDNLSLGDREHGVMLNFANGADVAFHLQCPQEPDRQQPLSGMRHRHPLHRRVGTQHADQQRLHRQPGAGEIRRHPVHGVELRGARQLLVGPSGIRP